MYESIKKKKILLFNITECTKRHLLFCSFSPNSVEKCWSVYHLLDRWLPCAVLCCATEAQSSGVTEEWNWKKPEAIRLYQMKKISKGVEMQCTGRAL